MGRCALPAAMTSPSPRVIGNESSLFDRTSSDDDFSASERQTSLSSGVAGFQEHGSTSVPSDLRATDTARSILPSGANAASASANAAAACTMSERTARRGRTGERGRHIRRRSASWASGCGGSRLSYSDRGGDADRRTDAREGGGGGGALADRRQVPPINTCPVGPYTLYRPVGLQRDSMVAVARATAAVC